MTTYTAPQGTATRVPKKRLPVDPYTNPGGGVMPTQPFTPPGTDPYTNPGVSTPIDGGRYPVDPYNPGGVSTPLGTTSYTQLQQDAAALFGGAASTADPFSPFGDDGLGLPDPTGGKRLDPFDPTGSTPIDPGGVPMPGGGGQPTPANPLAPTAAPGAPGGPGQYPDGINLPDPFKYDPFKARSFDEIVSGQAFQGRLKQGMGGIRAAGAGAGDLFSPNTVKGLIDYAGQSASAEYDKELDRDLNTYRTNYDVGTGIYDRNVDASVLRRQANVDDRSAAFGREVWDDSRSARDREYESGERRWSAEFQQRKAEYMRDQGFKEAVYADEATYKRYRDQIDDEWKRIVLDESRRQFLAGLGAR